MANRRSVRERFEKTLGTICLITALLLLPAGVRTVRAGDEGSPQSDSKDPTLVGVQGADEAEASIRPVLPPSASPPASAEEAEVVETAERAAEPAVEADPGGVIVLNTRGFNYGPASGRRDPAPSQAEPSQK